MTSFFLAGAEHQLRDHPLIKMKGLMDWEAIRALLHGIYRRDESKAGCHCRRGRRRRQPLRRWRGAVDQEGE